MSPRIYSRIQMERRWSLQELQVHALATALPDVRAATRWAGQHALRTPLFHKRHSSQVPRLQSHGTEPMRLYGVTDLNLDLIPIVLHYCCDGTIGRWVLSELYEP